MCDNKVSKTSSRPWSKLVHWRKLLGAKMLKFMSKELVIGCGFSGSIPCLGYLVFGWCLIDIAELVFGDIHSIHKEYKVEILEIVN